MAVSRPQTLRKQMTDVERLLWSHLKNRQITGCKFRRQHPIGPFIVDFICLEKGLVIELDGGQHAFSISGDKRRTEYLNGEGYRVLRFWNNEVLQETNVVLMVIREELMAPSPRPSPPEKKGARELEELR